MREDEILDDPRTSDWLRNALSAALACDPVQVANEAMYLSQLLQQRAARAGAEEQPGG